MKGETRSKEKRSDLDRSQMRAVVFDGRLRLEPSFPVPQPPEDWALIRVLKAGICGTDMEITRGYKDFQGILGHEFVGVVRKCGQKKWIGKRVVGEINVSCGTCEWCLRKMERHCSERRVLGIHGLNGCMADFCILPASNLKAVPDWLKDEQAALMEPLSAACEILEQLPLKGDERAVVLGDGRLGVLCAWVLCAVLSNVTLSGHHRHKLGTARWRHLKTVEGIDKSLPGADLVVEATGSAHGLSEAMTICRPRGTIVLKTTVADGVRLNLSPLVVNEQTLIGSRCGRFEKGLKILKRHSDMPLGRLISAVYPAEKATEAFAEAQRPDAFKVLLDFNGAMGE